MATNREFRIERIYKQNILFLFLLFLFLFVVFLIYRLLSEFEDTLGLDLVVVVCFGLSFLCLFNWLYYAFLRIQITDEGITIMKPFNHINISWYAINRISVGEVERDGKFTTIWLELEGTKRKKKIVIDLFNNGEYIIRLLKQKIPPEKWRKKHVTFFSDLF